MATPAPKQTASQTALTSAAVNAKVIAAATQSSQTKPANQAQKQGSAGSLPDTRKNPPQGFEGPATGLPGVSKPNADSLIQSATDKQATLNQAMGLVSQADAIKSLMGGGSSATPASSPKDKLTDLTGSGKTDKPASDQGFASKPGDVGKGAGTALSSNPMDPFRGGSTGGALGAAATNSQPTPTPGSKQPGGGVADEKETYPGATSAANATTNSEGEVGEKNPTKAPSTDKSWQNKLFLEKVSEIMTGMRNWDGTLTEKGKALEQARKADAGMPNPENTGSNVNILTQSLLDQLNAAKAGKPANQGGSGDVTPVREGGVDAVVRNGSLAVNAGSLQGQKLFGQPGGAALGENMSGGLKGLNGFTGNHGAGVINPGNEAGSPAGDSRFLQDPGAALGGGKPAAAPPTLNGTANGSQNSPSEQRSSVSATLAAGLRSLTLTGSAAINGSGNNLDNLISGNEAANELRGDAGDDSLDGKAGNDLLDGGSGRDRLTGGLGADRFRFATPGGFGSAQADQITDFSRSEGDRIELSRAAFGLSAGATVSFQAVSNDADLNRALASSTLLIQDLRNGSILFNQNGSAAGAGQGGVFAVVSQGLTLQGSDFALLA